MRHAPLWSLLCLLFLSVLLTAPSSGVSSFFAAPPDEQGGDIQVWVNTNHNTYHCPTSVYYGKTKQGKYMGECEARQAGYRPIYNRPCGSPCAGNTSNPPQPSGPPTTSNPTNLQGYTKCADENGTCSFTGTYSVAYGAGSNFTVKTFTNGTPCDNSVFGDPDVGAVKACYMKPLSGPTTSTPTTSATIPNLVPGQPYDGLTYTGQTLRYYQSPSYQQCDSDCQKDPNCRAWSWVKPGGYKAGDPSMCYLISRVDSDVRNACCVSATKASSSATTPPVQGTTGYVPTTAAGGGPAFAPGRVQGTWQLTSNCGSTWPLGKPGTWAATITLYEDAAGGLTGSVENDALNSEVDGAGWNVKSQQTGNTMTLMLHPKGWASILELTGTLNGSRIDGRLHHYTGDDCNFTMVLIGAGGPSGGVTGGGGGTGGGGATTQNCRVLQQSNQTETRDSSGRITREAAVVRVVDCSGRQFWIYEYVNRPGFRAIRPPDWDHALGGRDFPTLAEALAAAVASR